MSSDPNFVKLETSCETAERSLPAVPAPTIDIPPESLTTYKLLELCPPGYLPKSVTSHVIHSPEFSTEWKHKEVTLGTMPPYPKGTRLRFHFRSTVTNTGALLDDTHHGIRPKPMELITGRGFILEFWEAALNTMRENQVARFVTPKELCKNYDTVARVTRNLAEFRKTNGKGLPKANFTDLDELLKSPQSLTFILELLEVSLPEELSLPALYNSEPREIVDLLPVSIATNDDGIHSANDPTTSIEKQADKMLISRDYQNAAAKYAEALDLMSQLTVPETAEEGEVQRRKKISLLMKAAYCKLSSRCYAESLQLLTLVLQMSPDNPMALFRRGRCNVHTGQFEQARQDFARTLGLDRSLEKAIRLELALIEEEERKLLR